MEVEQRAADDFEIFDIVAMPNNFHGIEIEELHLGLGLGKPAAGSLTHTVLRTLVWMEKKDFTTKARRTRRFRMAKAPNFVLFVSFVVKISSH